METKYKVVNGTSYHVETIDTVIDILDTARGRSKRLKIYLGDTKTGRDWFEENERFGYIGRSTGSIKIPLLIPKINSHGGGALLDHCIVKIQESKGNRVLYQHLLYKSPVIEIKEATTETKYTHEVIINGELYGRCRSLESAKRLKNKMS